jgi:hypothetical protein
MTVQWEGCPRNLLSFLLQEVNDPNSKIHHYKRSSELLSGRTKSSMANSCRKSCCGKSSKEKSSSSTGRSGKRSNSSRKISSGGWGCSLRRKRKKASVR